MKLKLTLTILTCLILTVASAQDLTIKEQTTVFDDETYNALVVSVPKPDEALKSIEGYVKEKMGFKLKKEKKNLYQVEKVSVTQVNTAKRCDFVVAIEEDLKQFGFSCIYGYDYVINSQEYPEEMYRFKLLVNDILLTIYTNDFEKQIEAKEKAKKDLDKEMKQNSNESEKLAKSIQKNNKKMGKEEDAAKKIIMENENIASQERQDALAKMNLNLENEIQKLDGEITVIRNNMNQLNQKAAANVPPMK